MPEYVGTMEATIEIQSLQIVGFLSMVSVYIIRLGKKTESDMGTPNKVKRIGPNYVMANHISKNC